MLLNGGHALAKMDPLQAELYTAEDRATMSPLTAGTPPLPLFWLM